MLCCCSINEEPHKLEVSAAGQDGGDDFEEQKLSGVPISPAKQLDGQPEQKLPASVRALGKEDQFEVCLNKRSSGSFGFTLEYDFKENLHLDPKDPCLLLSLDGGAIEQWNAKNPEQRLQVGDRIVSANGTAGPSQQIFETIKEADEVTLVMQRAKETQIPVGSARSLGLDLAYADSAVGLIIKQVNDGPVAKWNSSASSPISVGDRVVDLGSGGAAPATATTLLEKLKKMEGETTVKIYSWPS